MIPASQRLYDAITEGRIVHPDDERLNAHVAAAVARHGRRGWRIDKANRADKIDAVVALAMAVDRLENRPEPTRLIGWL
jgi:phage terminase large subunit-like protein